MNDTNAQQPTLPGVPDDSGEAVARKAIEFMIGKWDENGGVFTVVCRGLNDQKELASALKELSNGTYDVIRATLSVATVGTVEPRKRIALA
jgi:hypothetical protein